MNEKPKCPYCGSAMKLNELLWERRFFDCPKCGASSPRTRTVYDALEAAMKRVPADMKPVVWAEWEECDDWNDCNVYRCSNCEIEFVLEAGTPKENDYNFCPVCGADMRGVGYTRNCEEFDTLIHEKRPIPADMGERSEGK